MWRWTDITFGGKLYLRRLHIVQTPWFAVMLHWLKSADPQRDLHDHPVSFLSIPLRGGYVEENATGTKAISLLCWNWKRATDTHRITHVQHNTLTLVICGPVVRPWGFHTARGFIPWREYEKVGDKL
ncbi:MAG: hypothetical protein ACREBU_18020 [Nitrososphaera sp.]